MAAGLADAPLSIADILTLQVPDFIPVSRPGLANFALMGAWHLLQTRWEEVLALAEQVFVERHRASSAIEGFNAAVRPHLYVHKRATQGFLELFRAYR